MENENEMIECGCGCKEQLRRFDNRGRERKIIFGHYSEERKLLLSKIHKERGTGLWMKGKHLSKETKEKISLGLKREKSYQWKNGRWIYRKIAEEYGIDLTKCQICKDEKIRTVIHHINGNKFDNSIKNLAVLCYSCHNNIHFFNIHKPKEQLCISTI
jgi:hypothetical protein